MKRVLIVSPSNKGTIAMCSLNLWKAFQQEPSVEVKCVLVYKLDNGLKEFDACDSLVAGNSSKTKRAFSFLTQVRALRQIKRTYKPDITISTLNNCNALNVLAGGKEKRIGVLHSPHYQLRAQGRLTYLVSCLEFRYLYPHLDYLACVSQEPKNTTHRSFPTIKEEKLKVIYNVHFIDEIVERAKEEFEDDEEKRIFANDVVLFCGRLDKNKAPDRLMRAFCQSTMGKTYHLVFVGPDEGMMEGIVAEARRAGLADQVHFLGQKSNPYKYMAKAKVLVSSSYSEGLPGVVIESLALGIPVICTNSTHGIWEIMGYEDHYDHELRVNISLPDGIITPNTGDEAYDDMKLEEALSCLERHRLTPPFTFREKVDAHHIVKQYLEL